MNELNKEQLITAILEHLKYNSFYSYKPYTWQKEFHDAGASHQERMLMAANRVGKTYTAAEETAMHLTGIYPADWKGKRFETAITAWIGSVTNEASRDITQKELVGGLGEKWGTGAIPKDCLFGKPYMRQAGIPSVIDQFKVRHISGGISTGTFKSYDQGWQKWQGTAPHVIWLDEEPEDFRIYTECQTRIITSKGIIMVTFTPLHGMTDLVRHFMEPKATGIYLKSATWDDAPHIDKADKERMIAAYPAFEVEARTKGVPMMGEGRVFPFDEAKFVIDPFIVPDHWSQIWGIDFGIDHPFAACLLAWDRDQDTLYITASYKSTGTTPPTHASAIRKRCQWAPIAWPHDGINREKSGGKPLKDSYLAENLRMLGMSARYENDKGGGQPVEPVILDFYERLQSGRLRVFSHCSEWLEEFRNYHRKDGHLVAVRDDCLKASFYAAMMKRYAMPRIVPKRRIGYAAPIIATG